MEVRKVNLDEIDAVLVLIDEFNRPKSRWPDKQKVASIYSSLIESGGCILGAFENERLIGVSTINICQNFSWSGRPYAIIENVIVTERYRNQGIGKAILLHSKKIAREAGCYKVALMTGSKKNSTLKFYASAGFTSDKIGFQCRFDA